MSNVAAGKDTDDEGESLNDVEKTLNSLGITLRKSQYEWKSFEDVLEEVAGKWNIFEDTEQSKIATAIAGVRQQENFRALMNNWDEVSRLTGVAEKSMGSASEKMEIYLNSIEAKTKEVEAAWEEFIIGLNQSDSYKNVLDFVIFLIDNLPTAIALIGSMLVSWKAFSVAGNLNSQAIAMREMLAIAINTETIAKELSAIATMKETNEESKSIVVKGIKNAQLTSLVAAKRAETMATEGNVVATQSDTLATEGNTVAEQANAVTQGQSTQKRIIKKAVTLQVAAATNKEKMATDMSTMSTQKSIIADQLKTKAAIALKTALAGLATVIGVVSAAISVASIGIMIYQNYMQNLQETVDETGQKIGALQEEIDDLDSVIEKYDEIIKSSGSAAKQKESLTSLQEQLISTYGEEAKALDLVNGKYETQVTLLKNLQKEKLAKQVQEYTNSQGDRDKLLNTETVNLVVGKKEIPSADKDVISQVRKIVSDNGGYFGENLAGDYGIWATGETQPQIYEALLEYQKQLIEQGEKKKAELIAKMLNRTDFGTASMKSDYDKFSDASKQEREKDFAQFQLDNFDDIQEYEDLLQKRNDLYKQYTESKDKEEKKRLLQQLEDVSKQTLDKQQSLVDKVNKSNINGLQDTFTKYFEKYSISNIFKTDSTALSYFDNLVEAAGKGSIAGKNIEALGNKLDILDEQFETGQINATQYFDGINKQIDGLDTKKIDELYGSVQNFNTMISSMASNTASYMSTLFDSFTSGKIDDFSFLENLTAAIGNLDRITNLLIESDKNGVWSNSGTTSGHSDLQNELYGEEVQISKIKMITKYVDKDGNDVPVDENGNPTGDWSTKIVREATEEEAEAYETRTIEITGETDGLDDATQDVKDSIEEINNMDLKGLDEAYEILDNAFADGTLTNSVDRTLDQVDGSLKKSAIKMATFLKDQVNSTNEAYRESAKNALDSMGLMSDASVEEIATAIIQTNTNLNAAAAAGNKIASTAMGKSIQNLGKTLIKLADVMDKFEMTIPIKIPAIRLNTDVLDVAKGGSLIKVDPQATQQTEIKIGAASTIRSIGQLLSENGNVADAIGELFTPIEADVKTKVDSPSGGYDPAGGGGKKDSYTAEDAASDLKDILQDIEGYEADIELDLEDQTEQFINQEMLAANRLDRLKEELDYYNEIYDVTEDTSKWLENQNKILGNLSDKVGELYSANRSIDAQKQEIIDSNSQYDIASWFDSEGNDTLAYGNKLNEIEYQKNAIEKETAARMREVYNSVAGSTDKDTIQAAKDKIKQIEEEGDIRIEALDKEREKIENIHDSVSELNDAWLENQEAIRETLAELHETVKEIRDELLDDIVEQLEKAVEEQNESIEKDVTRMEQLVTIQEQYNDILNETLDIQAELDSELQASLDSFEYLDEQMRQLMFNEEDYKKLSGTLTEIQEDIAYIWEDHYNQINALTDEEMYKAEYITAETERQLAMKMKEYELAKAELEVAKARTNLQNVQNERNVRMFVNGAWQWVADPNAVKDAQKQLADAEAAKEKIEREAEQQVYIDAMNKVIDNDNMQMDKNNELLEQVKKAIEEEKSEVKNIEQALANAEGEDLPALNDVLQGAFGKDGGTLTQLLQEIGRGTAEIGLALKGTTVAEAEELLKSGNLSEAEFHELRKKLGYGWDEATGTIITQEDSWSAHYKGWKKKDDTNTPLHTGENGSSITDNGQPATPTPAPAQPQPPASNGFPRQGKVTTRSKNLNIRSGAGTNYKVLGSMPKGASVTITGEANGQWAAISYNGINGYASRQYLTYDQGGLATGKGIFLKDINLPERVLSPQQTKAFDTLVSNLTTNPVLMALTKNTTGTSKLNGLGNATGETKQYYFSNFTVQADNISEFISSLDAMIPISEK